MATGLSTAYSSSMKSVVVISDRRNRTDYCGGFVAFKCHVDKKTGGRSTLVVAPSAFLEGREGRLDVCFFNGSHLPAYIVSTQGPFSLLRTTEHSSCEAIELMKEDNFSRLTPSRVFMVVPSSSSATSSKDSYMMLESLKSYLGNYNEVLVDSENYLLVSCDYRSKTHSGLQRLIANQEFSVHKDGLDRLTCAPVFDMSGETLGIIVQDCRILGHDAHEIKVALKSFSFKEQLEVLLKPVEDQRGKGARRKRKRSRSTQA